MSKSKTQTADASQAQTSDLPLSQQAFRSAPFMRRLASWIYDFLTAVAIAMLSTVVGFIFTSILESTGIIDITGYEDISAYLADGWVFQAYLLICLTAFFSYFWVRGGQTIGMRAWRLRVVNQQGETISIAQAVIRFYASLAGLGNLLVLVDFKNRQSLQDYIAKTKTIELTKEANRQVYREL